MSQSRIEQKYLHDFAALSLEERRSDYALALRFLVALLRGGPLPRFPRRNMKRSKRGG